MEMNKYEENRKEEVEICVLNELHIIQYVGFHQTDGASANEGDGVDGIMEDDRIDVRVVLDQTEELGIEI